MHSNKTTTTTYFKLEKLNKCYAGIYIQPVDVYNVNVFVAWEWQNQADNKIFAIIKKTLSTKELITNSFNEIIEKSSNYGDDVTNSKEAKSFFPFFE